jgi:dolichol-phosphate mannosyltransferase
MTNSDFCPVHRISFVIPVYNEEENLLPLTTELDAVAEQLQVPYEIWFVDDGSSDGSLNKLRELALDFPQVFYLSLSRNSGQSAALQAGFLACSGDVIITLDADLQNDPADIPLMLRYFGTYDMITGWRHQRNDSWSKRIGSRIGNSVRNALTGEKIHDTGCSLKIMRASLLKRIRIYRGLHRFLPTLMRLEGASVLEVKVNHRPRTRGKSKYNNLTRGVEGFYDLLVVRWMQHRRLHIDIRERSYQE